MLISDGKWPKNFFYSYRHIDTLLLWHKKNLTTLHIYQLDFKKLKKPLAKKRVNTMKNCRDTQNFMSNHVISFLMLKYFLSEYRIATPAISWPSHLSQILSILTNLQSSFLPIFSKILS